MNAERALEVVGAVLGCIVSLSVIVQAIRKAGRQLAGAAERKIEDTATEVAATIIAAVVEQVGGVERSVEHLERRVGGVEHRFERLEHRVVVLEGHVV